MGVPGDLLLTVVGVSIVAFAPLEVAFGTLVAFWLLVPGTLIVPHAPHFFLVIRLVLYAFALRLIMRRGPREPKARAYLPTPVHAALVVLMVVGFADGIAFTPRDTGLHGALYGWIPLLDLLVLFVVVTAVIRTISPRRAMGIIGGVLAVAVAIGFWERFSFHQGWSHFFFEGVPPTDLGAGHFSLGTRQGQFRSQVAGQFALEYGWVLTMLLPLSMLAAIRWTRKGGAARLALLLPLLAAIAVVFSGSRGAEVAAVVAILVFVLMAGGRHLAKWGFGAAAVGALFTIADPSLIGKAFTVANDPASVRLDRLPPLFALVVHRPFVGLGFNSLSSTFGGLDNGYAMIYATLGMLGILAWLTLIVTAIATIGRTLTAPRGSSVRVVGAACIVGIVAFAAAMGNYDVVNTLQSSWALMFLAALGTAVAERVPRPEPAPARRRWAARSLLPLAGAGIGALVFAMSPVGASESLSVFTISPSVSATEGVGSGQELVNTLCPAITASDVIAPGTGVTCLRGQDIFPYDYPGLALVTVSAPTPAAVRDEIRRAFDPVRGRISVVGGSTGTMQTGRPALAVTAPLIGGAAGIVAMLLVPPLRARRRRKGDTGLPSLTVAAGRPNVTASG